MRGLLFSILFLSLTLSLSQTAVAQTTLPGDATPLGTPAPAISGGTIFADVTTFAQIGSTRWGQDRLIGQAWGDYDQDGWYDLYVTDPAGPNILYHNNGDGTFSISPLAASIALINTQSSGAVFADYDNDGYPDLYVLRRNQPNVLYHNDAGRAFTDVSVQAGVADPYDGKTASWGDYDNDGFLDLYVANWSCYPDCGRPTEGDRDSLFRNNGDGTFTDVTRILGSKTGGAGFVASFVDYDNDGDQDIYLVNDEFINPIGNALWRNDGPNCPQYEAFGSWCFTEVSEEAKADTMLMGMGLAVDDFDGNGYFDFFFTNAGPMVMLQNLGDGTFVDVGALAGVDLSGYGTGWGTVSLDYDNDGFRDLYVALTETTPERALINPLFRNSGEGTFEDMTVQSGMVSDQRTLGVATADYDGDGWVDMVIGNYEVGYKLYRNQTGAGSSNARVAFTLKGGGPVNQSAVGARVTLTTADGHRQMQAVQIGSSLGAGNAPTLYFGLGSQPIQTLEIRWPDGTTQTYENVPADMHYTIVYGDAPTSQSATEPTARPSNPLARTVLTLALLLFFVGLAFLLARRMKKA
ncbi:MAG: CRTAC1 family protein [Anaerolineales bacterium]|nr:CRTAC1 family protein [Anaerolineales bacterium]